MESNTSKSKKLLEQALRLLPRDFALSNARAYLNRAISEVASVEIKRENRDRNQKKLQENLQKEKEKFHPELMTPKQQKQALVELDKLIETEENKLKELKRKKQETTQITKNQQLNG
jgi:hypothetical protein